MKQNSTLRWVVALQASLATVYGGSAAAVTPINVTKIARVTGATQAGETIPNPNQTHWNYQVEGTDLGILWDKGGGEIFALFGDTFGPGWCGNGGCGNGWRSNVLARSSDTNLTNGLSFSTMIQDFTGHAKEVLASKKIDNNEITVIPTAGVTVGSRHYIHYMSVHHWGDPGSWFTNYSGIAYSDDEGQNWVKHPTARWTNDGSWANRFQMASFVKNGGFVYMYATPNGRFGNIYLARVPEGAMLNINDFRYWDGNGWSSAQAAARPVAVGAAGELSVSYNVQQNRFLMTYLNEHREAVVMRDATTLTGPWSGEKILAAGSTFPGLYNAFIHPWSSGDDLYFVASQWTPYNTFLMRSTLTSDASSNNPVSEPGFETQAATAMMAPWYLEGHGGIDRNLGNARTGADNGFVRYNSGWNALLQTAAVQPHTNYTLKGWVRTSSNNNDGYFGARAPNHGAILSETPYGSLPSYTELTVSFNSGVNSTVELYSGLLANSGDTWAQLDDVTLTRGANLINQAGFEQQPSSSTTSPWYSQGKAGVDRNLGFARTGANNAWARNTTGWNAIKQEVSVEPNSDYTLTGWIKTSGNSRDGYFGARLVNGGPILNEAHLTQGYAHYTQLTVRFNSGSNHSIELYAGLWANSEDTWIQVDDLSLTKN